MTNGTEELSSSDGKHTRLVDKPASERPSLLPFGQPLTAEPLPRWPNQTAELPALRAELRRAEVQRDVDREREVARRLARTLVGRRRELDIAVRLGRRCVLLGDDELRTELADWHCHLGQTEMAVGVLAPLLETPGVERPALLVRIALYWARLGSAQQAIAALREALAYDGEDPLIHELLGMVHGWAPAATTGAAAAEAYVEAARCHERLEQWSQALQDSLRAFDTAPESHTACRQLAESFRRCGKTGQALEVERRHAEAVTSRGEAERAHRLHRSRMVQCVQRQVWPEAMTAALQAGLDAKLDAEACVASVCQFLGVSNSRGAQGADGSPFDTVLCELEHLPVVAVRLQLAAESAPADLKSECFYVLGQLLETMGGCGDGALAAYLDCALSAGSPETGLEPFRRHARRTGDSGPLLEALLTVLGRGGNLSELTRRQLLLELLKLAEDKFSSPGLALWCVRELLEHFPTPALLEAEEQLGAAVARQDDEFQLSLRLASKSNPDAGQQLNPEAAELWRVVSALRLRPDRVDEYREALERLLNRFPDEWRANRWYEALLHRQADFEALGSFWERQLARAVSPSHAQAAVMGLSRIQRQAGDLNGALAVVAADENRHLPALAGLQLTLAAQLGHRSLRAGAIARLAALSSGVTRGWLASLASSELLALGQTAAAVRAAELGTRASPELAAPLVAYARASREQRNRTSAVAMERAMALTFPSSEFCQQLVTTLVQLGDFRAAQAWTARWLTLRPAATAAAVQLMRLAADCGDAATLGDVVAWATRQAHPIASWATPLAEAASILAEGDRARAREISWSLLNAFGPEPHALQAALLDVAERCQDPILRAEILERRLARDAGGTRGELLLELAVTYQQLGDEDNGFAVLARALSAGVDPEEVLSVAGQLPVPSSCEGQYSQLQVRAWGVELLGDDDESCWQALRNFGAAQWDLAGDEQQATEIWLRAAKLLGAPSWVQFVLDLVEVRGFEQTLKAVYQLAESRDVPDQAAALLAAAALVALRHDRRATAFHLAQLSLDSDPGSVNALGMLESAAGAHEVAIVDNAYRTALGATQGHFGERAVHYRAARYFESRDRDRAVVHALEAFRAVPSVGGVLSLLLRLAQSPDSAERCSQAVQEQADRAVGAVRGLWLRHAALLAVHCENGPERRTQLLLEALAADPSRQTVDLLGFAMGDWARGQEDGRELCLVRLQSAMSGLLSRLEFRAGAEVAIGLAVLAISEFSSGALGWKALAAAVEMDCESVAYGELIGEESVLSHEPDAACEWLQLLDERLAAGCSASFELLQLASLVASRVSPGKYHAHFAVRMASAVPGDARLRQDAIAAVLAYREANPPSFVAEALPKQVGQAAAMARAERAEREADEGAECEALAEAVELEAPLGEESMSRIVALACNAASLEVAEQALEICYRVPLPQQARRRAARDVAARLLEEKRPQRALRRSLEALEHLPEDVELLTLALSSARSAGEDEQRQEILNRLIVSTESPPKKGLWLNEAWEVAKKRGQLQVASAVLQQWLRSDPDNTTAMEHLEAECEAAERWEPLVELLGRHQQLATTARERRRIVLRRCDLLSERLGRLEEARQLLTELSAQSPADRTVIERLAEVAEKLGDRVAAADHWFAASGLSSTRAHATQLAQRACELYLHAGELISARRVLSAPQALPRNVALAQLAVTLERSCDSQPALAQRLVELAAVQKQPTAQRAAALLEAANLWRRLGNEDKACECASRASGWLPQDAEAQVLASYLDSRLGRGRSLQHAERTAERLLRVEADISAADRDLSGYLLVEAVHVREGASQAEEEARRWEGRYGRGALLSAALAEVLVALERPKEALDAYDRAVAGELRGLRRTEQLALDAARVAQSCGLLGRAHKFLRLVEGAESLRPEAIAVQRQLEQQAKHPESVRAPSGSKSGHRASAGHVTARRLAPHSSRPTGQGMAEPSSERGQPPFESECRFVPATSFEAELFEQLRQGRLAAGAELLKRVVDEPARAGAAHDLLRVWWATRPGDPEPLALFRNARAPVHAAISHLSQCWGAETRVQSPVPSLDGQPHDPEAVRHLLFHGESSEQLQALAILWDGVHRSVDWPSSARLKGKQPALLSSGRAVAGLFFAAAARLGLNGTRLIELELPDEPRVVAEMAEQPVVVLRGADAEDSSRLRFELGRALAGTIPTLALAGCGSDSLLSEVLSAVNSAFGPPKDSRTTLSSTARLAAAMWETIPSNGQRKLQEACRDHRLSELSVRSLSYRVALRAGLFVSGDVAVALHQLCRDEHLDVSQFQGVRGLMKLADASHMARELLVMSASPEFARLRWQQSPRATRQGQTRRGM